MTAKERSAVEPLLVNFVFQEHAYEVVTKQNLNTRCDSGTHAK